MPEKSGSQGQPAKPVKLRESCDSCLLAKVKCSKARPLCSRCLANGAPCDYSPSSRAGKRNRNSANSAKSTTSQAPNQIMAASSVSCPPNASYLTRFMYPLLDEEDRALLEFSGGPIADGVASAPLQQIPSAKLGMGDSRIEKAREGECIDPSELLSSDPFSQNFMESFVPMSETYSDSSAELSSKPRSPAISMDQAELNPAWADKEYPYTMRLSNLRDPDMMPATASHFNDTIPRTGGPNGPRSQNDNPTNFVRAAGGSHQSCDCFAACLQILQSLHNHSSLLSATHPSGPPFDIVLTINREAIESCSTMLECTNCLNKSGRSISTMMLATIFGKVMSLYRAACFLRLGSSTGVQGSAQLVFGAYTVTGENRQALEIEILLLELRKAERVLKTYSDRFRNAQMEKEGDESNVYGALTSYLEKNLQYIVDFLKARKAAEKQ